MIAKHGKDWETLPSNTPLLNVPKALCKILNKDLEFANIPKFDSRGHVVDVHALRHTFGTHLSVGGVPLRTAQAAMRHSDPKLTANIYTDPALLDVAGALDSLPTIPLGKEQRTNGSRPDLSKARPMRTGLVKMVGDAGLEPATSAV